jgi:hypothetical protein
MDFIAATFPCVLPMVPLKDRSGAASQKILRRTLGTCAYPYVQRTNLRLSDSLIRVASSDAWWRPGPKKVGPNLVKAAVATHARTKPSQSSVAKGPELSTFLRPSR